MPALIPAALCFASFGWGMAKHFRRAGPPTRAMLAVGIPALFSATLHLAALAGLTLRLPDLAIALYVLSTGLFWWAVAVTSRRLAACGQGCVSARIVRDGPYRMIRHPFYAAYDIAWLAGFVATGWWPLGLTAIAMAALYEQAAREEERGFLASSLAAEYRRYSLRAGRYFPRLCKPPNEVNTRRGRSDRSGA